MTRIDPSSEKGVLAVAARALGAVALACRFVAILLLALMSILVVGQVVARNVFDLGLPWADELARFSSIALVFLCVPVLALRGQHVAVDMVPMMLPRRGRLYARAAVELSVLSFCAITLFGFHSFLSRAGKFATPAIGIPNWLFYAPALVGFLLLAATAALRFIQIVSGGAAAPEESARS